jgi:hypothetical protein
MLASVPPPPAAGSACPCPPARSLHQENANRLVPRPLPSASAPWMPLVGIRQQWARLAYEVEDPMALSAAGLALRAISWEMSALQYHGQAAQDEARGLGNMALGRLNKAVQSLHEAVTLWEQARARLDRYLRQMHLAPECIELARTQRCDLLAQQDRLARLLHAVQTDLTTWRRLRWARELHGTAGAHEEVGEEVRDARP